MKHMSIFRCISCQAEYDLRVERVYCACGSLLDVEHGFSGPRPEALELFRERRARPQNEADRSGIWRFREFVLPDLGVEELVTRQEGNTRLYRFPKTNAWLGAAEVRFKHEGENPTGSFKDRGMTAAMSWAKKNGAKAVVCASTGNTAAAVASYASLAGLKAVILISEKGTALGKVAQALAYGATTVMIRGDFDAALKLVMASREELGLTVLNSVNAVRLEGQKTIIWEALEQFGWDAPPDWIVVPGGNLGNTAAFGKALREAKELGWIKKMPRVAVIQAAGAAPFTAAFRNGWRQEAVTAQTIATAIKIGAPVNFAKAVRTIQETNGYVTDVTDQEIMDAKAVLDSDGVGAEPASCASAAGIRKLVREGMIKPGESVLGILTGNFLKDPDATIGYHSGALAGLVTPFANQPTVIDPDVESLRKILEK